MYLCIRTAVEHYHLFVYFSHTEVCIYLKEEVVRKTQSFERLKVESEKCLAQSEKITNEKMEFESALYAKVCSLKS